MAEDRIATVRPIEEDEATRERSPRFSLILNKPRASTSYLRSGVPLRQTLYSSNWYGRALKTLMHPEAVGRLCAGLTLEMRGDHCVGGVSHQRLCLLR